MSETQLFVTNDETPRAVRPVRGRDAARADGSCPACGAAALMVRGRGPELTADETTWLAKAIAQCCQANIGLLSHKRT